jgi:hypothetical protein
MKRVARSVDDVDLDELVRTGSVELPGRVFTVELRTRPHSEGEAPGHVDGIDRTALELSLEDALDLATDATTREHIRRALSRARKDPDEFQTALELRDEDEVDRGEGPVP